MRFTTILFDMIIQGRIFDKQLILNALDSISVLSKWRRNFIIEVFMLFLSIKGRINFSQLERYGKFCEQRYRQQFEIAFPFLDFNKELALSNGSGNFVIAFDPSYIKKSGKKTPGLDKYWSGCLSKAEWGLEIGGIAAIDIDNNTAFHLEAVQTLNSEDQTLTEWYADIISQRKDSLKAISKYIVADAWFSKKNFTDEIIKTDMHLISRLRDDADLLYLSYCNPTGKKGRPKKFNGKILITNIDKTYFQLISETSESTIYSAIVYSKSLKRNIKLLHVKYTKGRQKEKYKLYFSTDLNIKAEDILTCYKSRFQIEFLYRDGKQHTGLTDCQARSISKLNFHFNASLSSINIAKINNWLSIPIEKRKAFSMSDIKTVNHNTLLLQRFFNVFAINPNTAKNNKHFKELLLYGTIAA